MAMSIGEIHDLLVQVVQDGYNGKVTAIRECDGLVTISFQLENGEFTKVRYATRKTFERLPDNF